MLDHKVGAVPVTDRDGRLAGIVSYEDVLRNLNLMD
jgi:CBS domain-containing protein